MKLSLLRKLVLKESEELYLNEAYNGGYGDGGKSILLQRLKDYEHTLVVKYDLRPSEYYKLNEIDIDEPKEFERILNNYKLELSKNIKL